MDSCESISDTLARMDTEIRLQEVKAQLEIEESQSGNNVHAETATVENGLLNSPESGGLSINQFVSLKAIVPYDSSAGLSAETVSTPRRKSKLLLEKLFLEKELRRKIQLKKNKRASKYQVNDPYWQLAKSFLGTLPNRRTATPTNPRHALTLSPKSMFNL